MLSGTLFNLIKGISSDDKAVAHFVDVLFPYDHSAVKVNVLQHSDGIKKSFPDKATLTIADSLRVRSKEETIRSKRCFCIRRKILRNIMDI